MEPLQGDERKQALSKVPQWTNIDGRDAIKRTFVFKNFTEAFGFMTKVAQFADAKDHHPEWKNVYNTIDVVLSTHTANGITYKDIDLAQFMDYTYEEFE